MDQASQNQKVSKISHIASEMVLLKITENTRQIPDRNNGGEVGEFSYKEQRGQ